MIWKALVVEIIRILWGGGHYRHNKVLQQVHENWFPFWVEWKTGVTMKDVDRQIEQMFEESEVDPPIYWEEEGEGPLGGNMGLQAPWYEDND